jgi:uncharacterized membrane protein
MNRKPALVISGVLITYMLAIGAWAYLQIPVGTQIATHFDLQGRPNGYAGTWSLFLVPLVAIGIGALLAVIPSIEPRRANLMGSAKAYTAVWIGAMAVQAFVQTVLALNALHTNWIRPSFVGVVVGILLVVVGNYLGKISSNFFFGIRTPWTLSSELSWNKTHRLGGRFFIAMGLLMAVTSLLANAALIISTTVVLILGIVALVVYSYAVWSGDPNKGRTGRHEVLPR